MARRDGSDAGRSPTGGGAPGVPARARDPTLVGRARQLEEIERQIGPARSGGFRVVLVTGAAGLGKTRLVSEALARHDRDAQCLSARSYRWGATASFGPWVEALDRSLRHRDATELRDLCGTWLPDLAALLTSVDAIAGEPARPPRRERLLEGLATLLDGLSADQPVLVALDDAHLADSSSWEALRYLGRRLVASPVTVLATARPTPLGDRPIAVEVLLGLEEDGLLTRLDLEPLGRPEITELAHELLRTAPDVHSSFVTEPLVTWLMERSLGHPLFAIGLLRALLDERADLTAPRLERLPTSLRERVALEVGALDDGDRQLLELLAVADRRIELRELQLIADQSLERVGDALEHLTGAHLVVEHESGAALTHEVAHPIVQEAIYASIGGARRRALHRVVARALLDVGHLGAAAGHLARGAEPGDAEAVDALCRAMAQAESRGLHRESLTILAALIDLLPAGDPGWRRVLETMDWQPEWVLSHLAEHDASIAVTAMRRIEAQLADSGDPAAQATVQFHLAAFLSFGEGRLPEAEAACLAAVERFEAASQSERVLLARNELAWLHGAAGDLYRQAAEAGEVLDEALRAGHLRAALQAAATRAYALGVVGEFAEASELFTSVVDLARQQDNPYRVAWAHSQHAWVLALEGRLPEAVTSATAALAQDEGAADALAYENLAHGHWLAGRLVQALEHLEAAAVHQPVRGSRRHAWGGALAARLYAETGRTERARASLEQASATYQGRPFLVWGFWEPWTAGFLAWHERGPAHALDPLARVAAQLAELGAAPYELLVLTELTEVAAEAHAVEPAAEAADRLVVLAGQLTGGPHAALAALGTAWRHLVAGDHEGAAVAAGEAESGLATGGFHLHRGIALHALGRAHERHDRPAAVTALRAAAEAFDGCGAVWRRDRALSDLAGLGSRGRRAAAAVQGPDALTGREREVAALAVQGFTARQIGERLFIGRRTVESHLASCYAKLQISSRGELIRRAEDLGLTVARPTP